MRITEKGLTDSDLAPSEQNDKEIKSSGRQVGSKVRRRCKSAKVEFFLDICKKQLVNGLAHTGDQLRTERARQIKEQVEAGQYHVDSKEVAKSIARSEVSRLLEKK